MQNVRRRPQRKRGRSSGRLLQRLDEIDVLLHRFFARLALEAVPGVPLGAADHVAEARALAVGVAARGLLVERIELEQRHVVGLLGEVLRVRHRLLELCLEVCHRCLSKSRDRVKSRLTAPMLPSIFLALLLSRPSCQSLPESACRAWTPHGCAWTTTST